MRAAASFPSTVTNCRSTADPLDPSGGSSQAWSLLRTLGREGWALPALTLQRQAPARTTLLWKIDAQIKTPPMQRFASWGLRNRADHARLEQDQTPSTVIRPIGKVKSP